MSRFDFEDITSRCIPGSNGSVHKAAKMRTFPLPPRFIEACSRPDLERIVNILAAIVTKTQAIVITDFSRMTRLHVVSSTRIFEATDLAPASEVRGFYYIGILAECS